jgi:ATP-dependent Lon protease
MPGSSHLTMTGQLGDVMKESAVAALSYLRSHAPSYGIDAADFGRSDVHVHVPAGAMPKDGPSAGVALFAALASLFGGRPVRRDTAMTGELTLRGHVLPIGGLKQKVLGAHRAGIRRIVFPRSNAKDLDEIPPEVKKELKFIPVEDLKQVLDAALAARPSKRSRRGAPARSPRPEPAEEAHDQAALPRTHRN